MQQPQADATRARDARGAARAEWRVPAAPEHLRELRAGVLAFAGSHDLPDDRLADIALAVTEAATNAVLHAFVDQEPGTVRVVAEAGPGELRVRVIDDGRGMQPRPDSPGLGLGLPTIAKLAERMDVLEGEHGRGTEVAMTFAAPGVQGAAPEAPRERDLRLLAQAGALAESGGWQGLGVERLADLVVGELGDICTVDVLGEDGPFRRIAARVDGEPELTAWLAGNAPVQYEGSPAFFALRHGEPAMIEFEPGRTADEPGESEARSRAARLGLRWWLGVPLPAEGRVLGVLSVGGRADRPRPDEATVELIAELARRAAGGLANARIVAELQRTRRRLELILGALAEAVTVNDADGRVVYANPAAADLLGASSVGELLAAEPGELAQRFVTTREDGSPLRMDDLPGRRVLAGRSAEPLLLRSVERRTGRVRWTLTKATALEDDGRLAVNVIEDVTESTEAARRLRLLADAGEVLGSSLDHGRTLEQIARLVVPGLADWCAIDLLGEDGTLDRVALAHADPEKVAFGRALQERYPPDLGADAGVAAVLRTGETVLLGEITDDVLVAGARDEEHLRLLRAVGMRSGLVVALRTFDRTLGALTLVSSESGRVFTEADADTATELARRAAYAVENARLYTLRSAP